LYYFIIKFIEKKSTFLDFLKRAGDGGSPVEYKKGREPLRSCLN
jgi:hypothetical protein